MLIVAFPGIQPHSRRTPDFQKNTNAKDDLPGIAGKAGPEYNARDYEDNADKKQGLGLVHTVVLYADGDNPVSGKGAAAPSLGLLLYHFLICHLRRQLPYNIRSR